MALSADRKLDMREYPPVEYGYYVQAGARVFRGSILAICSDKTVIPAGTVGTPAAVAVVGIADHQQSNVATSPTSSLNAPMAVRARKGSFLLPFDAPPAAAAIRSPVYAVDDQTVSLSSNSGARFQLGVLEGFDQNGNPWVKVD